MNMDILETTAHDNFNPLWDVILNVAECTYPYSATNVPNVITQFFPKYSNVTLNNQFT